MARTEQNRGHEPGKIITVSELPKIIGQAIYSKLGFHERRIKKKKIRTLETEKLETESWKDPYVTELLESPLKETAKKILKETTPDDRFTCALSTLTCLEKYGPKKVKNTLDYGIPADRLYYVCPVLDQFKVAKEKGGESIRYILTFSGHVQGVGFRDTTFSITDGYGLECSYANNLPDGTVKVAVTATEPLLNLFLDTLKENFDIKSISVSKNVTDSKPPKNRK